MRECPADCICFCHAQDARIARLEAENNAFLIHTDGGLPAYAKAFARIKRRVLDGVMSLPRYSMPKLHGFENEFIRVSDIEALWEAGDEKALREAQSDG